MDFKKGETLYTLQGVKVEFYHLLDGKALVHPILNVTHQEMNDRGDDYYEYVEEERAEHLIHVPVDQLVRKKPLAALDDEIEAKKKELADVQAEIARTKNEDQRAAWLRTQERITAERQKEEWEKKFEPFRHIATLLEGGELFPLAIPQSRRDPFPPSIPNMAKVTMISLLPRNSEGKTEWRINTGASWLRDGQEAVKLFDTAEARAEHISALFEAVVAQWHHKQDFNSSRFSSTIDYGTLTKWVEKHPHLEIPADIVKAKAAHEAQQKQDAITKAREHLAELEAQA